MGYVSALPACAADQQVDSLNLRPVQSHMDCYSGSRSGNATLRQLPLNMFRQLCVAELLTRDWHFLPKVVYTRD
jgi:hypothetical protein